MRGDKEAACLKYVNEHIREAFFPQMGEEEQIEFAQVLNTAIPNSEANDFPDFIISNGFIEHFEINASHETKKGSAQRIEEGEFNKNALTDFSEIPCHHTPNAIEFQAIKERMNSPKYTHENLLLSLNKNFQKHIGKAHKYKKCEGFRIFLIENSGATFTVLHDGCYQGELYRPSFDREFLNYLSSNGTDLTHIVFRSTQLIEVIAISKIPELLAGLEPGITFKPGRFLNERLTLLLS